jgi:hypothetical protein
VSAVAGMTTISYDYVKGNDGIMYPFVAYLINDFAGIIANKAIYVPKEKCSLPSGLEIVCNEADNFEEVTKFMESKLRNLS